MEGVADADTGGGAREKWTRGDTGDRDGPARILRVCEARIWRTLAFEAREGWQQSQGHDEGHTVAIGMRSPDRVHQKCPLNTSSLPPHACAGEPLRASSCGVTVSSPLLTSNHILFARAGCVDAVLQLTQRNMR